MDLINKEEWSELQYDMEVRKEFTNAEICDFWTSIQTAGIKVPYYSVASGYEEYLPLTDQRINLDEIEEIRKFCPSIYLTHIKDQKQLFEIFLNKFRGQLDASRLNNYLEKINNSTYENQIVDTCKICILVNPYSREKINIVVSYTFKGKTYGHTAVIVNCDSEMFLAIPGLCMAINPQLINDEMKLIEKMFKQ